MERSAQRADVMARAALSKVPLPRQLSSPGNEVAQISQRCRLRPTCRDSFLSGKNEESAGEDTRHMHWASKIVSTAVVYYKPSNIIHRCSF